MAANKAATKSASTKKAPSTVTQKKLDKAKSTARKQANKSQVRVSRSTRRAENVKKTSTDRKANRGKGEAPHSARITAVRGPVSPLASKTKFVPKYDENRDWLLIDAAGQTVGRLASEIAMLLRGKHKATFTPNNDTGDFVVVINADQVVFRNNKEETKKYYHHSGYISGLKEYTPAALKSKGQGHRILEVAVKGMVPRNPLGRNQMRKLKIYTGAEHPHKAQNPVIWKLRHSA